MALKIRLARSNSQYWVGCLAGPMVQLMSLDQQMAEMKAYLKQMAPSRAPDWAWKTMKDLLRAGCWVGLIALTKGALMSLAFHLAVMWANRKWRDSEKVRY